VKRFPQVHLMAVFYVLPPRRMLGECLARVLRPLIPGVAISQEACADVIDSLVTGSPDAEDTYIVHREELPDGEDLNGALREGFGAETGDRIVLVSIGPRPDEPRVRIWQLAAA
jgi:hypothetical protein